MLKKHVKDEILDKFKIRKAYEIRRHYFQNAEGTPILLANGDAKVSKIGKEFANREQAEDYISGQDTSSETCSQKKQNRMRHDHWKEQIHEVLYIDFDGVIGVQDLLYIADIVSNNSFNTFPTADINQDGEISISDLILLIQQIIGD